MDKSNLTCARLLRANLVGTKIIAAGLAGVDLFREDSAPVS